MDTLNKPDAPTITFATCGTREVLKLFGDQWTALVFYALEGGTLRFSELRAQIEGISQKMLTQTLRDLERSGLVERVVYPVIPPYVEYSLTPLGKTLREPIGAVRQWAVEHVQDVQQARAEHDARRPVPLQDQVASLVQQRAKRR